MDFSTVAQNGEIGAARSGKSAANHRRKRDAYVTRPALAPDEHPQQVRRATQKQAIRVDETPRNVSDRAPKWLQDGLLGPYWWHPGAIVGSSPEQGASRWAEDGIRRHQEAPRGP